MIIVDTALKAREKEGRPIRVALIGAGFMSQGLAQSHRQHHAGHAHGGGLQPDGAAGVRSLRVLLA